VIWRSGGLQARRHGRLRFGRRHDRPHFELDQIGPAGDPVIEQPFARAATDPAN